MRGVQRRGDRLPPGEHLAAPFEERHLLRPSYEAHARLAAARGGTQYVTRHDVELLRGIRRTVAKQAMQEKDVEKAHRVRRDADRAEWIEVHHAHLDVLDAALAQGMQGPLARAQGALRPERAGELVFDLQQTRGELAV